MSRHRSAPAPRYHARQGRLVILGVSLTTTAIALLGGVGVLPSAADGEPSPPSEQAEVAAADTGAVADPEPTSDEPSEEPSEEPSDPPEEPADDATALPPASGDGKRVVFSEERQRVWLVGSADRIRRTYLVSGSLTDNLDPGTYEVFSRSEDALGIDDSGAMKWFVRFTQGDTGAAIGFHTIPVDDGARVQTVADLGTPRSHGCIRQATSDALVLWDFAQLGTTVVVTA